MSDELAEFLGEDAGETAEVETEVEAEAETEVEAEAAPVEKAEEEAEPAAAKPEVPKSEDLETLQKQLNAFKTQAFDERGKRQALQKQLEEAASKEEKPDIFEDPDAVLGSIKGEFNQNLSQVVNNFSEELGRLKHEDFDQVLDAVLELQTTDPESFQQVMSNAKPGIKYGESIYQAYKGQKLLKESGGVDGLTARISELQAKIEELSNKAVDVPPDLTTARSSGSDATVSEDQSLEALLGR